MRPDSFLDLEALWRSAQGLPASERMRAMFRHADVDCHDEDAYWVRTPRVALVGVGGLPIKICDGIPHLIDQPINLEILNRQLRKMMGYCGFMSYLNPKDKSPEVLTDTMLSLGHASTAHALSLNVMVLGISAAAETELCCQRDLVHLSRVTVARTAAQDDPSFVVLDETHLSTLQHMRRQTLEALSPLAGSREARNTLFPASKATMVLITGSLRNYQKLTAARDDPGKEEEYRRMLTMLTELLTPLAPGLFS